MTVTHYAVVPVKGRENTFVIFDADCTAGRIRHLSCELTEEEIRGELRDRGASNADIDAVLAKAIADGPLADSAA
jgi:hypothetical protein